MRLSYFMLWHVMQIVCRGYFRWRVFHPERVPASGPVVLAANHQSYLDPLLVGASLPRDIHCLARKSLFRPPLFARFLADINVVPLDREGGGSAGMKAILERLRRGAAILLFPEGTRTPDGEIHPAQAGIGLLIAKTDCPVVPVHLFGAWDAYGRHLRFPRPKPIRVKFGPPIDFSGLRAEARRCPRPRAKQLHLEATARMMEAIGSIQPYREVDRFAGG